MASRNFNKRSKRPHLLRANGVAAEVQDLRADIDESFESLETESDGGGTSKRFTAFGSPIVLSSVAPNGITTPPVQVIIEHEAGDVFSYTDAGGTAIPWTFQTADVSSFDISPTQINNTTTVNAVVVLWK